MVFVRLYNHLEGFFGNSVGIRWSKSLENYPDAIAWTATLNDKDRIIFLSLNGRRPSTSPIARVFSVLAGVVVFVLAVFVGGALLLVALALALGLAAVLGLRAWWWRRSLRDEVAQNRPRPDDGDIVDGEFIEVRRHDD